MDFGRIRRAMTLIKTQNFGRPQKPAGWAAVFLSLRWFCKIEPPCQEGRRIYT
jgi:hypothetical protein